MANIAYYCLHKLRITPRQFDEMDQQEKAFVIACVQIKADKDKKDEKKVKSKRKR